MRNLKETIEKFRYNYIKRIARGDVVTRAVKAYHELMLDMDARIVELERHNSYKQQDLNFMWKWIERGIFDKATTPEGALSVLSYYDSAPWYSYRKTWDTSHKDYDAAINERIADREKLKLIEAQNSQLRKSLARHHDIAKADIETYIKLDDDNFVPLNAAEGYYESGFWEETENLLKSEPLQGCNHIYISVPEQPGHPYSAHKGACKFCGEGL